VTQAHAACGFAHVGKWVTKNSAVCRDVAPLLDAH